MGKFTKLEKVIGAVGIIVIGGGLVLLHYEQRDNYSCADCFSRRSTSQWFVGLWPQDGVAISAEEESIWPSHISQDFFDPRHTHRWEFEQGSPYYLLGTTWGG